MRFLVLAVTAMGFVACGPSKTCRTPNSPPSFAADIHAITTAKCENCHSPKVKGNDRHGADASLNYETYDKMQPHADLAAQRVEKGEMPMKNVGVDDLTADEKDKFLQWVYCGAMP